VKKESKKSKIERITEEEEEKKLGVGATIQEIG
jgi:hypothetical protein